MIDMRLASSMIDSQMDGIAKQNGIPKEQMPAYLLASATILELMAQLGFYQKDARQLMKFIYDMQMVTVKVAAELEGLEHGSQKGN